MAVTHYMLPFAEEYCHCSQRWRTPTFIKSGKTAHVFRVECDEGPAALKIFEPSFFCGETAPIQVSRLELQQKHLVGVQHEGLIRMLDASQIEKFQTWAILMEYLPWPDLEDATPTFPPESIWTILEQLASAAQWLENQRLVHRDIKPSNILVSRDYTRMKLLDFGVLRRSDTFDGSGTPNAGEYRFVATRRYSSPRYLFGYSTPELSGEAAPDDLIREWRALTFYQIGGVLHDLIMGTPLFHDAEVRYGGNPQAALEQAVMTETPVIENPRVDPRLIDLARDCLEKEDAKRLERVNWDRFVRSTPAVSTVMASVHSLLQAPTSAEWDALQMAMRAVLQEATDLARDILFEKAEKPVRTRVYSSEPDSPQALKSIVSHEWTICPGEERIVLHVFEIAGLLEGARLVLRYGAALGRSWKAELDGTCLVQIASLSGGATDSCNLGSEIRKAMEAKLAVAARALDHLDRLQAPAACVNIRSD